MRAIAPFLFALAAASTSPAAEEGASGGTDLDKIKLGEHVYGPQLTLDDLKGRVVLLEFWGFK